MKNNRGLFVSLVIIAVVISFIAGQALRSANISARNAEWYKEIMNGYKEIADSYQETYIFRSGYLDGIGYFRLLTLDAGRNWYAYETDTEGSIIITGAAGKELLEILDSMDSVVDYITEYQTTLIQKEEEEIISLLKNADDKFKKALDEGQIKDAISRIAGLKRSKPLGRIDQEDVKEALLLSGAASLNRLREM